MAPLYRWLLKQSWVHLTMKLRQSARATHYLCSISTLPRWAVRQTLAVFRAGTMHLIPAHYHARMWSMDFCRLLSFSRIMLGRAMQLTSMRFTTWLFNAQRTHRDCKGGKRRYHRV